MKDMGLTRTLNEQRSALWVSGRAKERKRERERERRPFAWERTHGMV